MNVRTCLRMMTIASLLGGAIIYAITGNPPVFSWGWAAALALALLATGAGR